MKVNYDAMRRHIAAAFNALVRELDENIDRDHCDIEQLSSIEFAMADLQNGIANLLAIHGEGKIKDISELVDLDTLELMEYDDDE